MFLIFRDKRHKIILEAVYKISHIDPNQQKEQLKLNILYVLAECFGYQHTLFWDVVKNDLHEAPTCYNIEDYTLSDYLTVYQYYDPLHPSNRQSQSAIERMQHNNGISSAKERFYADTFLHANSYKDEMVMYLFENEMPTAAIGFLRKEGESHFTNRDLWILAYLKKTIEHLYLLNRYVEPMQLPQVTAREEELLHYVCKGYKNAEIARQLFVSENTVKKHLQNLYRKLQVTSRTQLASKYFKYSVFNDTKN